ncbi:MAG TPA: serine hydrolase [Lacunisphaera sp.]|nr:serine hydrolase [Lacunisphaera sp.]
MSLIWHLLRKDLRRLRLPLALFSLLVAGKCVFYAYIAGLFSVPDIDWLRRMQNLPEMVLRFLAEPVFACLLVGWMVFEDSPVETDPHWVTRPISGAQLMVAKLTGAFLLFVVWPLGLNFIWWLACAVGSADLLVTAREFLVFNGALVALAWGCAALTGGFPRFVLWSLVGLVVFGILQLLFTLTSTPGLGFERGFVCLVGGAAAAAAVGGYQFVTRRRRSSLVLAGIGLVVVGAVGGLWRWNFSGQEKFRLPPGQSASVSLKLTGPARYFRYGVGHFAQLPVRIDGVPDHLAVGRLKMRGNWSFGGTTAWTSQTEMWPPAFWQEAIRRQLGFARPAEPDGQVVVAPPFSLPMAERAVREPAALQVEAEVQLEPGKILAELPLRAGRVGPYAISHVSTSEIVDKRPGYRAAPGPYKAQNGVSLLLTEKSAGGLQQNTSFRTVGTHFALANRRTGQFFLPDPVRSGPEGLAVLNQTKVACLRLTYPLGQATVPLDEMSLVILRFAGSETIKLGLTVDPVDFAADSLPRTAPPAVGSGAARMAELLRAHAAGDRFMGSVLVAKGDAVLFAESTGWADLAGKLPNSANTRFRIGSLTKQFTAAAILLLQERGRLKVDDPLAKFLPAIPEAWRSITLRHLLTHTSGIVNFTNLPEHAAWQQMSLSPEDLVARLHDRPLDFAPGEKFNYSNTGYVLLGRVVELASGESYGNFLRDQVFLPLGMKDSGYEADVPVDPARATGYTPGSAGPEKAAAIDMHVPGGAGGLYSTTPDLLRWTQGLFGGKLLSPASIELMTTPVKNGYAFGLGVSTADGRKVIAHAGAIAGFMSALTYLPKEKLTVAVLANVGGAPVNELARQLADVALGKTVTLAAERKEVTVATETLQRYAGIYQLVPGVTNTVRLVDGRLTAQLSGQRAFPLFPESDRKFFLKVVDAQVEFVLDDQGRVTHLLQFQNGRTLPAARIGDVVERKAIAVPAEVLAAYPARYELRPDFVITITLEDGRLMAEAPGQGKSALLAENETKFFSATVDAQVEFVRDNKGAVTHLVTHVGGREYTALRKP